MTEDVHMRKQTIREMIRLLVAYLQSQEASQQ